jgi:hypothetical protein
MKKSYVRAGLLQYKKLFINKIRGSGDIKVIYLYSGIILTEVLSILTIERMQISYLYRIISEEKGVSPISLILLCNK